jgi:tol-pal system protein YbgF
MLGDAMVLRLSGKNASLVAGTGRSVPLRRFGAAALLGASLSCMALLMPPMALAQQVQQGAGADQMVNVVAQQQVRIGELERLVQDLTGQVEQAQYQNRELAQRLDKLMKDIDFRFQEISRGEAAASAADEGSAGGAAPQQAAAAPVTTPPGVLGYMPNGRGNGGAPTPVTPPAAGASAATPVLPPGTPDEQYNYSFGLLRKNDYRGAEAAFKAFLEQHKDHALAGNAQYWLGETYYARGDFKQAMVAFYDGYKTYPKSSKAPDNLLKLGITAAQIGQPKQACAAFAKLSVEYPMASDMLKRRAETERQRQGCN